MGILTKNSSKIIKRLAIFIKFWDQSIFLDYIFQRHKRDILESSTRKNSVTLYFVSSTYTTSYTWHV